MGRKRNSAGTYIFVWIAAIICSCSGNFSSQPEISPDKVVPTEGQITYQQMETIGFIHFSINTFTDKEWGYGDEDPDMFNPSRLDVEQWARVAKEAGLKELILTAKHHDGFCLWPSKFTDHSVRNCPYKNGNGDIVKEFTDACRKYGLKAGLYLSPWDRNHKDYGKPAYITYYRNQLKELLTQYGRINEIWFDGANGGSGWYGGANEVRNVDRKTYYDWEGTIRLVKELQPGILVFSDAGPDIRWIGNESGFAGETFWSAIDRDKLIIGSSDPAYLNTGDPYGSSWVSGECDVSIRPGWFYHKSEDSLVKPAQQLVDIYYKSVGRNAVMLLNLPPDRTGAINPNDLAALREFREIISETFNINLARDATCKSSNYRSGNSKFSPGNIIDADPDTYWAADDNVTSADLFIDLPGNNCFDVIMIQEPIRFGQRISRFEISVLVGDNWETVFEGTTIGYKRLIRIRPVTVSRVRLRIIESINSPAISNFGLFKASDRGQPRDIF